MRRRAVLTALGAGLTALSGCADVLSSDEPGPTEASRFAGESVPSPAIGKSVTWFHEADASTQVYVRPSVERARLPANVKFTAFNFTEEEIGCGHWDLYKLVDDRWYHVGPSGHNDYCRDLSPGGSKTWTLHAYPGEASEDGAAVYGHLGGGRYAAVAGYGHTTSASAAMVALVGDPIDVTPTPDVTAERLDGTVSVSSPRPTDEYAEPATLSVTRADGAEDPEAGEASEPTSLIAEQLFRPRYRALRNALPFFEDGVERVVLHTDDRTAEDVVGHDADVRRVRFEGQSYEARIDRDPGGA